MSGFGRPSAGLSNPARGVKIDFLRKYLQTRVELAIGPFSTVRDVAQAITQILDSVPSAPTPRASSPFTTTIAPTWCEKMKTEANEDINPANLHVVVSADDLFFNTLVTIERAIESNAFDSIVTVDAAYVYFIFLDYRRSGNNVQMRLILNGQYISKITNCLLILSQWQQIPNVLQEHLCLYSLFQARAQTISLILSSEALEKSLVSALISEVDLTYSTFLSNLHCAPNTSKPGLATIEEIQAIQSSIIAGNPDTVKQYKKLSFTLRGVGGKYILSLLRKHLQTLLSSTNAVNINYVSNDTVRDAYDRVEFALIRILYQQEDKSEAMKRNNDLLQRLQSQLQLLSSNEQDSSSQDVISVAEKLVNALLSLTDFYTKDLRFLDVQTILSQFISFASQLLGSRHLLVLRILKELGACHRHLGRYEDALNIFQSVQEQLQPLLAAAATAETTQSEQQTNEERVLKCKRLAIECFIEIGCCQNSMQQKDAAHNTFTEVLQIARQSFSPLDSLCLQIEKLLLNINGQSFNELTHIADVYGMESMEYRDACYQAGIQQRQAKNSALAANLLGKAYDISLALPSLGEKHLKTTSALQHHALSLIDCGEIAIGVEKLQLCYQIRKETQGACHEVTIRSLYNLAEVLNKLQRFEDALQVYEECLQLATQGVQENMLSATHDLLSTLHISLAKIFERMGERNKALMHAKLSYEKSCANSGDSDRSTIARYQYWVSLQEL